MKLQQLKLNDTGIFRNKYFIVEELLGNCLTLKYLLSGRTETFNLNYPSHPECTILRKLSNFQVGDVGKDQSGKTFIVINKEIDSIELDNKIIYKGEELEYEMFFVSPYEGEIIKKKIQDFLVGETGKYNNRLFYVANKGAILIYENGDADIVNSDIVNSDIVCEFISKSEIRVQID